MSRLRQASMLRESQLTHVYQVACQPEIERTARISGPSTSAAGLPLVTAAGVCAFRPVIGTSQRCRPPARPGYGLAPARPSNNPAESVQPSRTARQAHISDRSTNHRKQRIRRPMLGGGIRVRRQPAPESIRTPHTRYFSCEIVLIHWVNKKDLTAGEAALICCRRAFTRGVSTFPAGP